MHKSFLFSAITFFALAFVTAVAQETAQDSAIQETTVALLPDEERIVIETKDKKTPAMENLKPAREYRRRLPNGFAAVVDAGQREKIYSLQAEYFELIELLKLRIELLEKERDTKIDAVLSPAQLERARPIGRRAR